MSTFSTTGAEPSSKDGPLHAYVDAVTDWIREHVRAAGAEGTVVALSGGIDAAVTAALCRRAFPDNNLGVILPCHSAEEDEADARLFAEAEGVPIVRVDLTPAFDVLVDSLDVVSPRRWTEGANGAEAAPEKRREQLATANLKPRLRMSTLYYLANKHNYLVVGTENLSELTIGYFTKHGDGGVDILPIANLVKTQVVQLARFLRVPERIVNRIPGAGLWPGQTDEAELGMGYDVIDRYILTGEAPAEHKQKIERLHRTSEHKRRRPPIAAIDWPL